MHDKNVFVTFTYADENLIDPKLNYEDFQNFMKRLRDRLHQQPISYIVAGEYGSKTKRPHWHAILFGYEPDDKKNHYLTPAGHQVSTSESLSEIWGLGHAELGTVTLESASYCARYALKELEHGDRAEEFEPIFKPSTRPAIGRRWLEKYADDVFNFGRLHLASGDIVEIPRYYKKWCEEHRPDLWSRYVTKILPLSISRATSQAEKEFNEILNRRRELADSGRIMVPFRDKNKVREELSQIRLSKLHSHLKD